MIRAAVLVVFWVLALPSLASEQQADDPQYWLERLGPALTQTSYRGVFVYARGDQVSSMQVAHRYRDGLVEERLVMQDGQVGEIVRKGMNVVCVLPEHGRLELTNVIPSGPFAEVFASQLVPVDRWYQPDVIGRDRIAGHDVVRLVLNAKDDLRYSHQLWLEKSTGLPLKGKVVTSAGEVLEYFHFTSLTISDRLSDEEFVIRTEGRQVSARLTQESDVLPDAKTEGWSLGWKPEGFQPAATPSSGSGRAVAFSDGLASFSVFVEPASGVKMPSGTSRIGATTLYLQRLEMNSGDFLVTVVGEIPLATVLKVAESVEIEDSEVVEAGPK